MSHLLVIELPGGNDPDVLDRALAGGHRISFLTADPAHYLRQAGLEQVFCRIHRIIPAADFTLDTVLPGLAAIHALDPFEAVLCLQDLRIVEAAGIAHAFGLRHLSPDVAQLTRDKQAVRARLAAAGIPQPPSIRVNAATELLGAVERIGLPALIKPVDGFGSQHVFAIRNANDVVALTQMRDLIATGPEHYGLGVDANGGLIVERLLEGQLVGCDTLTVGGRHMLLGVNEKLFFPPPSFAIRGGCFTVNVGQFGELERQLFAMLDAIGFDNGAAHVELMLTAAGPQLVEINPRLVGARIARLIDLARGRSVHDDLIALHLKGQLPPPASFLRHAVTRWLAAPKPGTLRFVNMPPMRGRVQVLMLARPGDHVGPPFDNADRLGCVMTYGARREAAERGAEKFLTDIQLFIEVEKAA